MPRIIQCTGRCGEKKDASSFYKRGTKLDKKNRVAYYTICKVCQRDAVTKRQREKKKQTNFALYGSEEKPKTMKINPYYLVRGKPSTYSKSTTIINGAN